MTNYVYVVECGNEHPPKVDSIWATEDAAWQRVEELDAEHRRQFPKESSSIWDVHKWRVRE